jgi:hypothetical protein
MESGESEVVLVQKASMSVHTVSVIGIVRPTHATPLLSGPRHKIAKDCSKTRTALSAHPRALRVLIYLTFCSPCTDS